MGLMSVFRSPPPGAVVEGTRVYLRAPTMNDFPAWRDLRLQSRGFLEPWEPTWTDDDHQPRAFRARLRRYGELMDEDLAYPFFVFQRHSNTLLGGINLSHVRRGVADTATLGYWVGEAHARQGYMADALLHLCKHGFTALGLHRIEAACLPRNQASIRLLQRVGFTQEGYARSYLRIAGTWEDHLLWARLASDPAQ